MNADPDEDAPGFPARVRAVLAVARRIAAREDPLGREARAGLLRTTGLSPEGVELALTEHLERQATPLQIGFFGLSAMAPMAEPPDRVFVVLAGTVCVAAVRAIALALAAGPNVLVKASRRDPTLAAILVRELEPVLRAEGGSIRSVSTIDGVAAGDAVHAYGADETLATIRASLPPGVIYWPHGTGFGVAIVADDESVPPQADAIARDVVPFDQRGCLSPRIVLVEGPPERAREVALALHASLTNLGNCIPRGALTDDEDRELQRYVELMRACGEVHVGTSHVVGLDSDPSSLWLAPACRAVHVVPMLHALPLLAPFARHITSIGGSPYSADIYKLVPDAERAKLGMMQRPPFVGPVDLRTRPALT